MDEQTPAPSATDTFLGKLKEQSFTILIMVGVLYYQHSMWQTDREQFLSRITALQARIDNVMERERDRTIEREKYLMSQRDQFIEMLKEQATWRRA
jgi:hypothetical protein